MSIYAYGFGVDFYEHPMKAADLYDNFMRNAPARFRNEYLEICRSEKMDEKEAFVEYASGYADYCADGGESLAAALITHELETGGYDMRCMAQDDYLYIPVTLPEEGEKPLTEKTALRMFSKYLPEGCEVKYLFIDDLS